MGFFDQLGDVAKNVGAAAGDLAKQIGDKTNEALEISKLNSKISAEKIEIEKEKKKISEALFDKFTKGEEVPEEIKEFCENIKARFLNIDNFKEEIEKVKNAAGKKAGDVKKAVKEKVDDLKEDAKEVKEKTEDALDSFADKAEDVKDEAADKLNEVKEDVDNTQN